MIIKINIKFQKCFFTYTSNCQKLEFDNMKIVKDITL